MAMALYLGIVGGWKEQPYETSLTVAAARPTYVDALARTAAHLSRRRGPVAATAAHAGESYMEALTRAAARLAVPPTPDDPRSRSQDQLDT